MPCRFIKGSSAVADFWYLPWVWMCWGKQKESCRHWGVTAYVFSYLCDNSFLLLCPSSDLTGVLTIGRCGREVCTTLESNGEEFHWSCWLFHCPGSVVFEEYFTLSDNRSLRSHWQVRLGVLLPSPTTSNTSGPFSALAWELSLTCCSFCELHIRRNVSFTNLRFP